MTSTVDTGVLAQTQFYQAGLTGFRALAAVLVLLFHVALFANPTSITTELNILGVDLRPLIIVGWVGVDLFFVLSAFLLTTHFMGALATGRADAARSYLLARVRRVFPAYWMQLAVLFAVQILVKRSLPDWTSLIPFHIFMLQFLDESLSFKINPVYWTLPIEFLFYLCLPAIARILWRLEQEGTRNKWFILGVMCVAAVVLSVIYRYFAFHAISGANNTTWLARQFPGASAQFMAGIAAAATLRWWKKDEMTLAKAEMLSSLLVVVGLTGVVSMMYHFHRNESSYWRGETIFYVWHPVLSIYAAIAVTGVAMGGPFAKLIFENRAAVWVGTISYSIYLWHWPILEWIRPALASMGMGLGGWLFIAIPLIVIASALSYYTVERTFFGPVSDSSR